MSYLVLARKYRPQTFEDVVGQEHVTRTLHNAIAQGRLHHAFLFTGARGVGKTTAARILAKALSCVDAPTPSPCNVCDACREITAGTSVDVQEIDAASNNGVDNIRELRESIRYAPVRGKKKVYILDEVHMLSSGAWNALLKTLEEPPPHAIFVFATTDPHKLPATILSRVQRYDFRLVPVRRIVEHLEKILGDEKIPYETSALSLIARESGGSVRDALSLVDQAVAGLAAGEPLAEGPVAETLGVADRALVHALGRAVVEHDAAAALALVDAAFARGGDMGQLAAAFLAHLRDLLVAQAVPEPAALIDAGPGELAELVEAAKAAPPGLFEHAFHRFAARVDEIARSPVPRHVLDVAFVELTLLQPLEALGPLLGRLETLEGRLRSGAPLAATPRSSTGGGGGGGGARAAPAPRATPTATPAATPPPSKAAPPPAAPPPAAPAPLAAPTEAGATPTQTLANFPALVEAILNIDPMLSPLAQARLVGHDERRVTLGFEREFAADGIRERLPALRKLLARLTGANLAVEVIVGPAPTSGAPLPGTETLIEVEQRRVDTGRDERRQEALRHPARKLLEESFGGTWQDPVVDDEKL